MHISGTRPVKPDRQILIPTAVQSTVIPPIGGFVSLYLGKTKEKVSIKNNTVFLFYKK